MHCQRITALCALTELKFLLRAALRAALNENFSSVKAQSAVIRWQCVSPKF